MERCSAVNCYNIYRTADINDVSFFSLPKNEAIAKQWLQFCENPQLSKTRRGWVCSAHFRPEDIIGGSSNMGLHKISQLRKGAIPCLRNGPETKATQNRYKKEPNNKRLESDLHSDSDDSAGSTVTKAKRQDLKRPPKKRREKVDNLDMESSEAVIDEMLNQIEDLRKANLRSTVNFQLTRKKYKMEIDELKRQLKEANARIILLEMEKEENI